MPLLLTRTSLEDLKTDARVIGSCPYRTGVRAQNWQPDLWADQRRISQMQVGEVLLTSGKVLECKCGMVAMPPIWEGGSRKETLHLAACYDSSLRLALKRRCRSVAFTLLSGDCNGFPRDLALKVASETIQEFLQKHELTVYLSVKDAWVQHLPKPRIPALSEKDREKRMSTQQLFERMIRGESLPPEPAGEEPRQEPPQEPAKPAPFSFRMGRHGEEAEKNQYEAFFTSLNEILTARDLKDPQICQMANLERKTLQKLRSGSRPGKRTVLALCVGLGLDLSETEDLLEKAGYAFSPDETSDLIIKYYITQGNPRIHAVNQTLFIYEQPLLGP